ncbi:hypothetical protein OYC64_018452 [Pagothenia borchgrevinki]|uniref:Laminin subunit gamma-2 n=1 Tax=Pagothenia borchgrevinki TaxID=8213 RepID=A0ABD2GQP2_PAGBO
MRTSWISVCGLLAAVCAVQATHTFYSTVRCDCNGRSRYCLRDAGGLHCVDCQGHFEGRHCERCKDGFHQQGALPSCTPCRCNPTGAVSTTCDSRGRCSCKDGVTGDKCDRCPDGPIGATGCKQSRQPRQDSGNCFCYGHSSRCSAKSGYSVHNITSTFASGPDGWRAATARGDTPPDVHFRWSPKHQDLEVISKNTLPVYLYAPARYLGNRLLSYGQNFSFSLRLDRGVRHPSVSDVILEGNGLKVTASLGELRSIVPCGQKVHYNFRLDEQPSSRWRPQISSAQFHSLLQNLTAIKIRVTFGENGRGYLNNVRLVSAHRGAGPPAGWVQTCSCPTGYDGDFCDGCSAGFRRSAPADGAFSPCEPCSCRGGSCDPLTGDCYSGDQSSGDCSAGSYRDPWPPRACLKCPCPEGRSCSLADGSLDPRCDRCPAGTTGDDCSVCQEGFYGGAARGDGVSTQTCRPCQCNGHIDVSVVGSCHRGSGECLKCVNNTNGPSCESCLRGFYHSRAADACKACDCSVLGSESGQCDDSGRCRCRPGFEGLKCQRSNCPACFTPIKRKMQAYAAKLAELERLFSEMDAGLKPANKAEMEAALNAVEELVDDLQYETEGLTVEEKKLQTRLTSISRSQLDEEQEIQNVVDAADDIEQQERTYSAKVKEVQALMEDMKRKLDKAKADLRSADIPQGDAPLGTTLLSSLVPTALSLADKHQTTADSVERTASEALTDSKKSLALVRDLMTRENKVQELIGDMKAMHDKTSAQVKSLENQGVRLSDQAKDESKTSDGMLKDIANMERSIPADLKGPVDAMVSRLDDVKVEVDAHISDLDALQDTVRRDKTATEDLLAQGKDATKEFNKLVDRVDVAKVQTEDALKRINSNTNELEDALNALRGFDQQIEDSKSLADDAIKRLPGINATIQQAVSNNDETSGILGDVSADYDSSVKTINLLGNLVTGLENTFGSLPPHTGLLNQATKLNKDSKDLKQRTLDATDNLTSELEDGRTLEGEAEQAADGATAALNNARNTRDGVGKTLRDINALLAKMDESTPVDENQLHALEVALDGAQQEVQGRLRPRLRDMEAGEDAYRRRLSGINRDISSILKDIINLEDILAAVPSGCYNSPPIEEA